MALIELTVVEQQYRAVLAVQAGASVSEVATRLGVSRQSVHTWLRRYAEQGLSGLQVRRHHSKWGSIDVTDTDLTIHGDDGPAPSDAPTTSDP